MHSAVLQGLKVLVVEDVDSIRSLVVRIVESLGAGQVSQAMGIESALAELEHNPFDIVLLDYELNGRDGLVVLKKLREDSEHFNHDTPVVLLTGHAEAHIVAEAMGAGADDYLVKPVMPDKLGQRIAKVLEKRHEEADAKPASEVVWGRRDR